MTGVSTSAINIRILRGSNVVGDVRRITSAPGGSQDQKHFVQIDENTAGGSTTYHLEMKKGTWQGQNFNSEIWNVELLAEQVKR